MAAAIKESGASSAFNFPREYYFPPFFTRQTNLTTLHAQMTKWSALILAYCAHYRIYKLSLSEAAGLVSSTTSAAATVQLDRAQPDLGVEELFHNRRLNRRLSHADVKEVIDFMRKDGRAEYVGAGGGGGGDVVWIYWRTPEEWATLVERWVDETAQKGAVLTLYELTQGESSRGTEFHGLDSDLLQKALQLLVKRGKAQIFGQEDSLGVKFF